MERIVVTNGVNKAFVLTEANIHHNNKYVEYCDNSNSTTMATLNAVIDVLESIPEDSEDLHIIYVPECLSLMIRLEDAVRIRDNEYRTKDGVELSEEFVDLMCYANELRAWLTPSIVKLKLQGSCLLYEEEQALINKAWNITKKIIPKPTKPCTTLNEMKELLPESDYHDLEPITTKHYKHIYCTDTGYVVLLPYEDKLLNLGIYDSEEQAKQAYDNKVADIYRKEAYDTLTETKRTLGIEKLISVLVAIHTEDKLFSILNSEYLNDYLKFDPFNFYR